MTIEDNKDQDGGGSDDNNSNQDQNKSVDVDALVKAAVAEQLKDIKGKLDGANSQRDEALKKLAEKELAEKDARKKQLEEEGKHKELMEIAIADKDKEIASLKAENEVLKGKLNVLSRDNVLREALSGLEFRNDKAANVAFKELVSELEKDEEGNWKHKSGKSIKEAVADFAADETQSFLFKAKVNTGGGSGGKPNTAGGSDQNKSLFSMKTEDVLRMAERGELPQQKRK
jgi:hypothetical protein